MIEKSNLETYIYIYIIFQASVQPELHVPGDEIHFSFIHVCYNERRSLYHVSAGSHSEVCI